MFATPIDISSAMIPQRVEAGVSVPARHRIEGALDVIMMLFEVPEELRRAKVAKVLSMDYGAIGREIYKEFQRYVTETNEQALEEVLKYTKIKTYK